MKNSSSFEVFPIIVPVSFGLKSINFYLVRHDHSLTLIDAGLNTDECWQALENTLKNNGFSMMDITEILLTHHHFDHVGLVNKIVEKHDIPVYAHPNAIPRLKRNPEFLQMRVDFYKQLYDVMGCGDRGERQVSYLQNAIIQNDDHRIQCEIKELSKGQFHDFEVLETPGHSPDQVAFFIRDKKWLFAGDLLINHISSNALVEPDHQGKRMKTVIQHKHSLNKCLTLNSELVFSSHGVLIEKSNDLIQKRIKGIDEKSQIFLNYIKSGISVANDLAKTHYKHKYEKEFSLVMSEIIGHLDYLEEEGEIKKELDKEIWHYFSNVH